MRAPAPSYAHAARLILILSLAPTVGLGIGRFAYSLVLPDMREQLAWSYSAAGFMNTINAAGYLVGALCASRLIQRFGLTASVRWSTVACALALALCAISGNFAVLSFARLLVGFAADGRARNVIIEFESLAAAHDCYHSPEYQRAVAIRQNVADGEIVLVEGI